jgi:hypothetical protein
VLAHFQRHPEQAAAIGRRNAVEAIRRFDWSTRWAQMLDIVGMTATPKLGGRRGMLDQLASAAQLRDDPEPVPSFQ